MSSGGEEPPTILILSFKTDPNFFANPYASLLTRLIYQNTTVLAPTTDASIITHLEAERPKIDVVLVVDPDIALPKHRHTLRCLVDFVEGGGKAVLMGPFSALITPSELNEFLDAGWSLPWVCGDRFRTTVRVNPHPTATAGRALFKDEVLGNLSYSIKAAFMRNVPMCDRVYVPTPGAMTESAVLPNGPVEDPDLAAVVWTAVLDGWLGLVGDVGGAGYVTWSSKSEDMVLRMCGLS